MFIIGNGSGFDSPVTVSNSFCKASTDFAYTNFDIYPKAIGDVDGDGKDDIIGFEEDGVYVSFSQGKGINFTPKTKLYDGFARSTGWYQNIIIKLCILFIILLLLLLLLYLLLLYKVGIRWFS